MKRNAKIRQRVEINALAKAKYYNELYDFAHTFVSMVTGFIDDTYWDCYE